MIVFASVIGLMAAGSAVLLTSIDPEQSDETDEEDLTPDEDTSSTESARNAEGEGADPTEEPPDLLHQIIAGDASTTCLRAQVAMTRSTAMAAMTL